MKKGIGILLLGLVLLLGACGTDSVKDTSSVKDMDIKNPFKSNKVQVDEDGKLVLKGKVSSGANVTLERKSVKVDKNGNFKVNLENFEENDAYYGIEVTEKNGHWNAFTLTVEPNEEYHANIKKQESEEEQEQKKLAKDASDAMSRAEQTLKREDLNTASDLIDKVGMGYLENLLERKDALEKKILAKEENDEKLNAKANASKISFNMLNKNADRYTYESYYVKGQVIQAIEEEGTTLLRVNITKNDYGWEDTVAILYDGLTDAVEDDVVEVYGTIYGNYTYDTTVGGAATIPGITATSINVTN
ncbi:hypothetical protein F1F76_08695 [Listeria monocytogenes]|nr:hypothetical protein [Listeria monocytogenes]EAF4132436.1 hypothetical protein [Listeria monocytogenes]EAF4935350.1 hypothetical protein [Listeria monocytogenes]ECR2392776.1 hypothetical protein [Listeria monocytogenes]ECR2512844.1 hypothetical protein [Listeria monocytogenes]